MKSFDDGQQPSTSSKVGNTNRQPSVSSESEVGRYDDNDNFGQPGSSNAEQGDHDEIDYGNRMSVEGLKCSLHGTIYQLKLSILFLQTALDNGYKFKLYSEKKGAEKFDDVVFQYDTNGQYRFLQAKHKLNSDKSKITVGNLRSGNVDEPFGLQKYFISFRRIKQKPQYKGKIKDLVICTNADFNDDIKENYIKEENDDNDKILNVRGGKCYKFIFRNDNPIVEKLKEPYDLNRLAKELVKVVFGKKKLNLRNELFKNYHVSLVEKVFDKEEIREGGKKKWHCKFKKDFIENSNLSQEAELLRNALDATATEKGEINSFDLRKTLSQKKFAVSSMFGRHINPAVETSTRVSNTKIKQSLPNDFFPDAEIKEFLEKLIFAVEQPNEEELGEHIQDEIRNSLDCLKDYGHVELIYDHVQKQMLDWLKRPKSISLTEKDNFFKEGAEKLITIMHSISDNLYGSRIKETGVIFDNTSETFQKLKHFLNKDKKILNAISSEKSILLSQAKCYQVNEQSAWPLKYVLILSKYNNCKEKILFKKDMLIILCKNESQNKDKDIKRLHGELTDSINNYNKKIVLITQGKSTLANYFKDGSLKNDYDEIPDFTTVKDLDQRYLQGTLLKTTIKFQGQETSLAYLLGIKDNNRNRLSDEEMQEIGKVLKQEILVELISKKNIEVGNDPRYYDRYYINITRTFNHHIMRKSSLIKCFKECKKDLFAFCYTIEEYVYSVVPPNEKDKVRKFSQNLIPKGKELTDGRFFVLTAENPEEEFKYLTNNSDGKNVHWLSKINGDKFVLKCSNKLSDLRKFTKTEDSMKKIEDIKDSIVIIAGDPGIGKSTVLTTFSDGYADLSSWFIRVNLKNHEVRIEIANFDNMEGIMEFFFKINLRGLETALAKSLLGYFLKHQGQVILLLDGYDEIKDQNQGRIIRLLKTFKDTNGKVCLTTRIYRQCEVENALGVFSYSLNPFDVGQQREFLKKFWIKKLEVKDSDQVEQNRIDRFTNNLLNEFRGLDIMKEGDLVGIVLQARMVAEIFENECKKYKFENVKFTISNIFDLYERFIKHQFETYLTEKKKIDKASLGVGTQNALFKSYTEAHGFLAIKSLFSEDPKIRELLRVQTCETFPKEELYGIGLIKKFKDTDTVIFIHYTYAEYFVAKLSVNMFSSREDHHEYKLIRDFLLRNIFLDRNKLIHIFFKHEVQNKSDLSKKWKTIQRDCVVLGEIEREGVLQLCNVLPVEDCNVEVQRNGSISAENLNKLKKNVQVFMEWKDFRQWRGGYFYNQKNTELINKLFQAFFKVTDIEQLKPNLFFLAKTFEKSYYVRANKEFLKKDNIYNAVRHYLIQTKLQNSSDIDFEKHIFSLIQEKSKKEELSLMLGKIIELMSYPNRYRRRKCIEDLVNIFISMNNNENGIQRLRELNDYSYYFHTCYSDIISYVNSIVGFQKELTVEIIKFLESVNYRHTNEITGILNDADFKSLQSFYIDITQHSNVIDYTKSNINQTFQGKEFGWLERQGVLISSFLKILTPEMAMTFNSCLNSCRKSCVGIYTSSVFDNMISCVVDTLETEDLPQINKLAFLKMIVSFTNNEKSHLKINAKQSTWFRFNSKQLNTILKLIENMLKEQYKPELEVAESVEFLYMLRMAGLKLIDVADQKLLVLDPASGLQCELFSSYKHQIKELIKWKYDQKDETIERDIFFKKCLETLGSRKNALKRTKSEDALQGPIKKFKNSN